MTTSSNHYQKRSPSEKLRDAGWISDATCQAAEGWFLAFVWGRKVAVYGGAADMDDWLRWRDSREPSVRDPVIGAAIEARKRAETALLRVDADTRKYLLEFMAETWTPEGLSKNLKAKGKSIIAPKTIRKRMAIALNAVAADYLSP